MLHRKSNSCRQAGEDQIKRDPTLEIEIKGKDGRQKSERRSHVGGHQCTVRQDVRLKHEQGCGNEGRFHSKHLSRAEPDQRQQTEDECRRGSPARHQHALGIGEDEVMPNVEIDRFAVRHAASGWSGIVHMHGQQRQGGDEFQQGRVLGIPAKISAGEITISGMEVIDLVGGDRPLAHGGCQLHCED